MIQTMSTREKAERIRAEYGALILRNSTGENKLRPAQVEAIIRPLIIGYDIQRIKRTLQCPACEHPLKSQECAVLGAADILYCDYCGAEYEV